MGLIANIEREVRQKLEGDGSGHDWWHIHRVRNNAMMLCRMEGGDEQVVELAALLHDIADHKFHNGDLSVGPAIAKELMRKYGADEALCEMVARIISEVSYKGAGVETPVSTVEAAVVQDADRLDAIGAIGIARAFAYGGHKNRLLYDPEHPPKMHEDFEAYRTDAGPTVNHFYEKLLLLKDRMQTSSAKRIAQQRHTYMEEFLEQFYSEWEGKEHEKSPE